MKNCARLLCFWVFSLSIFNIQAAIAGDVSACNSQDVNKFLERPHLKFLDIEVKKSRKWAKNYFRVISSPSKNIISKYKKKFKATIIATYSNDLVCEYKAKIRINGDWKDHVIGAPPLITSLDVKLIDGHINSIVKFKLLLPHTRHGDNEVFIAALLREAGFISPRTYYVPSKFNGQNFTYLFQEKAQKEMIESFLLREGPILEGDERFIWSDSDKASFDDRLGLSRVVNKNWTKKGGTSLDITIEAVSLLNRAYLNYLTTNFTDKSIKDPFYRRLLQPSILSNGRKYAEQLNQQYKALLIALRANHALRPHNRSFYYDPMYKYFLPIYYDGDSDFLENSHRGIYPVSGGGITEDEIKGVPSAIETIRNIDIPTLQEQLRKYGLSLKTTKIENLLEAIVVNLKQLQKYTPANITTNKVAHFATHEDTNKLLAFSTSNNNTAEICDFSLTNCEFIELGIDDYSLLLSGRYANRKGQDYIYVGSSKSSYEKAGSARNDRSDMAAKPNVIDIENGTKLISYGSMSIDINRDSKVIKISQSASTDRSLLVGGKLDNWTINFQGTDQNSKNGDQRFNDNLLTGCLTLLDLAVSNVTLIADQVPCEDGVNLVRVKGDVNEVIISNAQSDALDIDFSDLLIDKVVITNAGNDCIDFSSGTYKVTESILTNCDDKAISIGEGSTAEFVNVTADLANIGIASKDSSYVKLGFAKLNRIKTCLYVARKKQEYWGGKITVEKYECPDGSNYDEPGSLIEVGQ